MCVDGKVEDEPVIEEKPIIEDVPVAEDEPIVIDDEPLVIDESGIVHHPEPHVIEQEPEAEPEPIPQPKPKRKRNYPQVGEPTLREEREDNTAREDKGMGVKTVLAGVLAVMMAVSTGVMVLAFAGAAVFFLPMIGGMRE